MMRAIFKMAAVKYGQSVYVCKQMNRFLHTLRGLMGVCCFFGCAHQVSAQIGGNTNFQVLQAISPARIAALGGNALAVKDGDLNLGLYAPSLLDSTASGQVAIGFNRLFGEASISHAGYAQHINGVGTLTAGILSLNYGSFEMTDETGANLGSFNAGEYVFQGGIARQLDDFFSLGANVKFALSELAEYKATAIAVDVSGTYYHPAKGFTATLLMRNIGRSLASYRPGVRENLPFEIQAGISKRLEKAPIRFGIIYENAQVWRLSEDLTGVTTTDPLTGEPVAVDNDGFLETLGRHLVFNTELLFSENFHIRLGYNYNRRQELKIDDRPGLSGFTYGFGLRISKFHLSYGRATYSLAGVSNHFAVSFKFEDFKKS